MRTSKTTTLRRDSSPDAVTAWAKDVVAGKVAAGPHIRNAAARHLDDLKRAKGRGIIWDVAAANRAQEFFPAVLCLSKGKFEGQPFSLEPVQKFIVGSIFGWKKKATGARRFRRAYIEVGKGNGKSPLAAGIGMYCMLADNEPGAEIYAAASKRDQAMVLFQSAVAMRKYSPALSKRLAASGNNPVWNLADFKTGSFFRPISSEDGQSGPLPSCALCDEIHEHKDGRVVEMLERGFKSRRQPLLIMITNSGSDRKSVCWEEHLHAIRASAGNRDLHGRVGEEITYRGESPEEFDDAFSFVCGLDDGDDPLVDPACWVKANPLIGITIPYDELERATRQAKAMPGKLNNVLRLHFCVWTDADSAWMSRESLESVLDDFDPAIEHAGERAYAGIDLSASQDLTAVAFIVPTGFVARPSADGKSSVMLPTFDAWVEAWTPGDTIAERAVRDGAPYEVWAEQGWLNALPGKQIRIDQIASRIADAGSEYRLEAIAYDRYAYRRLKDELDQIGVEVPQFEHPQGGKRKARVPEELADDLEGVDGLWMPGSIASLETLIIEQRIRIRRSPVLISAAMSAAIESDAFGNRWFSKRKATNRIDAIVALAMAVGVATMGLDVSMRGSAYNDGRELLIL